MISSPATASAGAASAGTLGVLVSYAPLLFIFVIFYVLLIRPQQQRVKQHRSMVDAVKRGDVAVTGGGVIGKVVKIEEGEVELEVASGVRIRVLKAMLSDVRAHGAKPAND